MSAAFRRCAPLLLGLAAAAPAAPACLPAAPADDGGDTAFLRGDGAWRPISDVGAPTGRIQHTAVWTGREMVVWGGFGRDGGRGFRLNDGARYDPAADRWAPVSDLGAPAPGVEGHTAVWTGASMIVLGNRGVGDLLRPLGGAYDADANAWRPIAGFGDIRAPGAEFALWIGREMVTWTAVRPGTGRVQAYRYDPAADSWRAMSRAGSPRDDTENRQAVWTGSEMIVWGGRVPSGEVEVPRDPPRPVGPYSARYTPATDAWAPVSDVGAPWEREGALTVWTGTEMVLWGGAGLPPGAARAAGTCWATARRTTRPPTHGGRWRTPGSPGRGGRKWPSGRVSRSSCGVG